MNNERLLWTVVVLLFVLTLISSTMLTIQVLAFRGSASFHARLLELILQLPR